MKRRQRARGGWMVRLALVAAIVGGIVWLAGGGSRPAEAPADPSPSVKPERLPKPPPRVTAEAARPAAAPRPDAERLRADDEQNRPAPRASDTASRPASRPADTPPARAPEPPIAERPVAPAPPAPVVEPRRPVPSASDESLTVLDLTTAATVDRAARVPDGISDDFAVGPTSTVWAYAVIRNDSDLDRTLTFVWRQDGVERTRQELHVAPKAARWRTWSRKNLLDGTAGRWSVELVDEAGLPLASRTFAVR